MFVQDVLPLPGDLWSLPGSGGRGQQDTEAKMRVPAVRRREAQCLLRASAGRVLATATAALAGAMRHDQF
jgi:hypothetical protein